MNLLASVKKRQQKSMVKYFLSRGSEQILFSKEQARQEFLSRLQLSRQECFLLRGLTDPQENELRADRPVSFHLPFLRYSSTNIYIYIYVSLLWLTFVPHLPRLPFSSPARAIYRITLPLSMSLRY